MVPALQEELAALGRHCLSQHMMASLWLFLSFLSLLTPGWCLWGLFPTISLAIHSVGNAAALIPKYKMSCSLQPFCFQVCYPKGSWSRPALG